MISAINVLSPLFAFIRACMCIYIYTYIVTYLSLNVYFLVVTCAYLLSPSLIVHMGNRFSCHFGTFLNPASLSSSFSICALCFCPLRCMPLALGIAATRNGKQMRVNAGRMLLRPCGQRLTLKDMKQHDLFSTWGGRTKTLGKYRFVWK